MQEIRLRPEAEQDLDEAAIWYDKQQPGLGQRFLDEVLATFVSIAEMPRKYPSVHRATRRAQPIGARFVWQHSLGETRNADVRRIVASPILRSRRR